MPPEFAITIAGEQMQLLGDRALFWPRHGRLLVADLHLGKADIFRRAGIALPRGGTAHDLDRLSTLIDSTQARELWVLGDMLHGVAGGSHWRGGWQAFRARHAGLRISVLTGNHDRALAGAGLGVELPGEAVDAGPFALRHEPQRHDSLHVLCGHLHPRIVLPGITGRWPGFWLRPGMTVLPAFSEFTGGYLPRVEAGEGFAVCVDGGVVMARSIDGA